MTGVQTCALPIFIGSNDAFHLPASPGYGYLKVDTTVFTRFRSGYVSGPADELELEDAPQEVETKEPLILPVHNGLADTPTAPSGEEEIPEGHSVRRTVVDAVVDQLAQAAPALVPVWLEPLPRRLSLEAVLRQRLSGGPTSLTTAAPDDDGRLCVPIGLVDDPAHQRQDEWELDLSVGGGHISIQIGRAHV